MNIKLDFLGTHLEAMSLLLQYKTNPLSIYTMTNMFLPLKPSISVTWRKITNQTETETKGKDINIVLGTRLDIGLPFRPQSL